MRKGRYYLLSIPERTLRSLAAMSGGLVREIGNTVLPARIRRTALYRTTVGVTLRFLIQELGQVPDVYPSETRLARDFLLRSGASRGIEVIGLATLHVSPVWVLAALADAAGAGKHLMHEIAAALREEGLLDHDVQLHSMDEFLAGLERTSSQLAETLNLPPLDLVSLRREWAYLQAELPSIPAEKLPSFSSLEHLWADIVATAAAEKQSVFTVASTMALSTISRFPANALWLSQAAKTAAQRTGAVIGETLLSHYRDSLREMSSVGFAAHWRHQFRPYLRAAAMQFTAESSSTERLLRARTRGKH